jgi:hypothetical protein
MTKQTDFILLFENIQSIFDFLYLNDNDLKKSFRNDHDEIWCSAGCISNQKLNKF